MKRIAFTILMGFITECIFSQTPDWSTSIANVLYSNCSACHHDEGIAPFPLMTYNDAVLNGFSIQADVNASKMPPWPPDPAYSHFRDERVLTDSQISQINDWVDGGMPLGDTTLAPQQPVFNGNVLLQNPDDTLILPAFTLPTNSDSYRCFAVHSDYTETKYLNVVEVIPGNSAIVHHLFLFHDSSNISYQHDLDDPQPGFFGGFLDTFSPFAVLDVGWTPGSTIFSLPANMGIEVPAGSDFVVSIHYAPGHVGETDSTKVYLKWSDDPNVRTITNYRLLHWHLPSLMNPPFEIPANEVKTFYEQSTTFPQNKSLVALQPHMHLIGKSFEVFMVTAAGDTTGLLYIPQWNFYWQLGYFVKQIIKIPEGAQIFGAAVFDNTTNNPDNPNNPPLEVVAGESTFDEMMSCRFWMMDYHTGDENILLDSSVYTSADHPFHPGNLQAEVFPNPADNSFHFVTSLPEHNVKWTLKNQMGITVRSGTRKNIRDGIYSEEVEVKDLPAGLYIFSVQSGAQGTVIKFIIER